MRIDFTKMHGVGNDFIVFEAPPGASLPAPDQLRRLADRHIGIGFDQALVLEPPRRPDTAVFYRIFNSDGAEVEQCGNGARCIAALLHWRRRNGSGARTGSGPLANISASADGDGFTSSDGSRAGDGDAGGDAFTMDSPAGLIRARIRGANLVSVDMGIPSFDPRSLPFDAAAEAPSYTLQVGTESVEIGAVSMGNPHAVLQVAAVESAPVERLGPAIESHRRFPQRVNVGFMQVVDRTHIRLRVYERGAGETLACGTGACAAVALGRRLGLLDSDVHVSVRGGELRVNWGGEGEHIWLTGPAEVSFEGHVEV